MIRTLITVAVPSGSGSGSGSGLDNNGNGGTDVFQGLSPVTVEWRRGKVGW